jgi:ActR/RegA family two-component response regulator
MADSNTATHLDLLIVDDDDYLPNGLVRYFRDLGFYVREAGSAESAIAELESRAFGVAIQK